MPSRHVGSFAKMQLQSGPLIRAAMVESEDDRGFLEQIRCKVEQALSQMAQANDQPSGPLHIMVYGHGVDNRDRGCASRSTFVEDMVSDESQRQPPNSSLGASGASPGLRNVLSDEDVGRLLSLTKKLVEVFDARSVTILSVRLLVAPPNCEAQLWHLDYRTHASLNVQTVFAALTPCVADNCTEVLWPVSDDAQAELETAVNDRVTQLRRSQPSMDEQDIAVVDVRSSSVVQIPLLMDPYEVTCVATSRLPHRRGPTLDMELPMTRIVLNCDFTSCSEEEVDEIGFVDDDAATSKHTNCISHQNVVDDLHTEVVIRVVS